MVTVNRLIEKKSSLNYNSTTTRKKKKGEYKVSGFQLLMFESVTRCERWALSAFYPPWSLTCSTVLPCVGRIACVYVSGLAKSHPLWSLRLWYGRSASKLSGMTILQWTLIQEFSFYPRYLRWTRERMLHEKKDGIFFFLNTSFSGHTFFTVMVCIP